MTEKEERLLERQEQELERRGWIEAGWGLSLFVFLLTLLAIASNWLNNFLHAPIGIKDNHPEAGLVVELAKMACIPVLLVYALFAIFKNNTELAGEPGFKKYVNGKRNRKAAGDKALIEHHDIITEAKRLCTSEGLSFDKYGCPEGLPGYADKSSEANIKRDKARRVAENYRPILLKALEEAIGPELLVKLGEPRIFSPRSNFGHDGVLAHCMLEFDRVDQSIFGSVQLPRQKPGKLRIYPYDRNITVSRTATFGTLDSGYGEEYVPGNLRVTVGVSTMAELDDFYLPWRYQINPTSKNFLQHLVDYHRDGGE